MSDGHSVLQWIGTRLHRYFSSVEATKPMADDARCHIAAATTSRAEPLSPSIDRLGSPSVQSAGSSHYITCKLSRFSPRKLDRVFFSNQSRPTRPFATNEAQKGEVPPKTRGTKNDTTSLSKTSQTTKQETHNHQVNQNHKTQCQLACSENFG